MSKNIWTWKPPRPHQADLQFVSASPANNWRAKSYPRSRWFPYQDEDAFRDAVEAVAVLVGDRDAEESGSIRSRIRNAFFYDRILTMDDITNHTRTSLYRCPNLGMKCVAAILRAFPEIGADVSPGLEK